MSQTPPNGPTPVPGGQPNQGFPQAGYQPPPSGQFPPAGPAVPQAYPNPASFQPGGYPQQPYGSGGVPGQGGYPMPGGYPQPPAGKASSSKVLLIVIAAVVALALIGGGIMLMSKTPQTPSGPTVPAQPSEQAQPTQPAQPTQTAQPTDPAQPTTPTTPTSAGAIDLGHGVQFVVADGWQIGQQEANLIKVTDGKAVLLTQVIEAKASTNALQLCDSYNRQLLQDVSGAKFADPEQVSVNLKSLSVGKCLAGYVQASGSSSKQLYLQSFVAVRSTDGATTLTSILFTKETPQTSFDGAEQMISVVLTSQAAG